MRILTSAIGNKSFTLIELLIVLLIIGIASSFATLSINTARPSETQKLFKQLQNQLSQSKQISQLKNINLRLIIKGNQSEIEQLNPLTQKWLKTSDIQALKWKNIVIESSEPVINISPNGYITPTTFKISLGNESYQIKTK
jgi:prepilin-type N-terminal cleavage/methylation domain-containing protein